MPGSVQTVLGPVSPGDLGPTTTHEHLDESLAVFETLQFKVQGGGTIVDATTYGIGRDPRALARISRLTGVNVVMGAGYYVDIVHPGDMDGKTESELADEITGQLMEGVDGTGIGIGVLSDGIGTLASRQAAHRQ